MDQQAVILEGEWAAAMDGYKALVTHQITPCTPNSLVIKALYLCAAQKIFDAKNLETKLTREKHLLDW
jgi:hypothetical protein